MAKDNAKTPIPEELEVLKVVEEAKTNATAEKAAKSEITDKSKRLFKSFQKIDTLYFTADGTAFASNVDATNHAKTLSDNKVQTINRK